MHTPLISMMSHELKGAAEKEVKRLEEIMRDVDVVEPNKVYDLALCYYQDAKHFLAKEMYLEAFEAAVIAWAYMDALLHMNKIRVAPETLKYFTADPN